MITFTDIKVIGAATAGLVSSGWDVILPVLEGGIVLATFIYVAIRAWDIMYKKLAGLYKKLAENKGNAA